MDQVEIEITGLAITQRYGTLSTGHRLRTDAAYAAHLVNDAQCARYTKAAPSAQSAADDEAAAPAKAGKKKSAAAPE